MAKSKANDWLTKDGLLKLEAWARNGLTNEQIASNMGICRETLNQYKNKYSDIADALKRGKEVVDIQVENALLKRALGYDYEEKTYEDRYDKKNERHIQVLTKTVTKHVQPDTTAQIFWLKNRKPKEWRDKQEIEHSGNVNNPFEGLTTEELREVIKNGRKTN